MKRLLTISVFLIAYPAFSQQILKDQVMQPEGYRVIQTSSVSLDWSMPAHKVYGSVFISKTGDTTLSLVLYFKTPSVTTVDHGARLVMELNDGQEMEFRHAGREQTYENHDPAYVFITLDQAAAEKLKRHSVVKYRVYTQGANVDVFIRKNAKDRMKDIICILEETMRG